MQTMSGRRFDPNDPFINWLADKIIAFVKEKRIDWMNHDEDGLAEQLRAHGFVFILEEREDIDQQSRAWRNALFWALSKLEKRHG